MKKITCCEEINKINECDKPYYNKHHNISIGVSNALYYQFEIYANHETEAFEILATFLQNNNGKLLYSTYEELQEAYTEKEIEEDFLYVDGGIYFNIGYINISEIKE